MENASKALIMAGSVLIGIMLLGVVAYLINQYGSQSASIHEEIENSRITAFNTQFLKYYRDPNDVNGPILCTAHDIVSVVNLAQANNKEQQLETLGKFDENIAYVQIFISDGPYKTDNAEKWNTEKGVEFIQNSINNNGGLTYYRCYDYKVSDITKRVCYLKFKLNK